MRKRFCDPRYSTVLVSIVVCPKILVRFWSLLYWIPKSLWLGHTPALFPRCTLMSWRISGLCSKFVVSWHRLRRDRDDGDNVVRCREIARLATSTAASSSCPRSFHLRLCAGLLYIFCRSFQISTPSLLFAILGPILSSIGEFGRC